MIRQQPVRQWFLWLPWIGIISVSAVSAGGYQRVDFFHLTESGVSVTAPMQYIIYLIVVGTFFGLAVLMGPSRRVSHHLLDGAVHDHRPEEP